MFGKLAHLLARWQAKLKYRHAVWYIGMFIETLARKNENWHTGTLAHKLRCQASPLARRPLWHVGTHGTRISKLDVTSLQEDKEYERFENINVTRIIRISTF